MIVSCNAGHRLDNFIVGLSNATPSLTTVIRSSYPICGVYPGRVTPPFNPSVQCAPGSPPARHLIIQQSETGLGQMNFCEVEVWTNHTSKNISHFVCLFDANNNNNNLLKSFPLNSNQLK